MDYALSQRIPKLLAIILTGVCVSVSTTIFQTITGNNILTPNVMGLDSLYVLIQTVIVFVLGSSSVFIVNKKYNFINALKKTFYPKRFRRKLIDEISVRILFLIGKL